MKKFGFTLAEVLITLAIIGVVAALTIPSVVANTQQQEFKTGLKKAVSVLNSAITMNMAIEGESPYENKDTFKYLQRHMSVLKSTVKLPWFAEYVGWDGTATRSGGNAAFYTTDGMRFETDDARVGGANISPTALKLHESDVHACFIEAQIWRNDQATGHGKSCGGCGSYGLTHNPNNTTKPPCALLVDVNGDRKPTPKYIPATASWGDVQQYKIPTPNQKRISDIFTILITDDRAIPYGVTAQKAMYEAQK